MDDVLLQPDDVFPSNACMNGLFKTWQKNCAKRQNCEDVRRDNKIGKSQGGIWKEKKNY